MTSDRSGVFRPEIEGLRAVAAGLVAVFHIWFGRVSGGVDVFFVVSAFLITTGLVAQVERTGTVDFARFWGRLIRRLLPAALLVLCAVIVASLLWQSKSRWKDTIEGVAAAAVYLENWLLAHDAVDYLARNSPQSPVTHFWALSIQGQFYLAWPLITVGAAYLARRSNVAFRRVLVPVFCVLLAGSLAYSIYITRVNQPYAYFSTFARVWEFCIGALLALLISRLSLPNATRLVMGWVGLLAIVSCGFIFQVSSIFPGYAAAWPTLGAALVIIAGTTRGGFGADRLLACAPMVYLGSISYGIYLWHFPILTLYRAYTKPDPIGNVAGLCIVGASVALAALTKVLVEDPLRGGSKAGTASRWRPFALGAVWMLPVVIGLGSWTVYYRHLNAKAQLVAVPGAATHPGARVMEPGFDSPRAYPAAIYPGPLKVDSDREDLKDPRCTPPGDVSVPETCVLGAAAGKVVIAVVGGSHSSQWLPALESIGNTENWKIVSFARINCPFHLGEQLVERERDNCVEWNRNVIAQLLELHPDAVFTTSTRAQLGDEIVPEGYVEAWRVLEAAGIRVIGLRDNPDMKFEASDCVELNGADARRCALVRAKVLEVPSPTEALPNPPSNVVFIDLSNYLCNATTCPPVIGNVMVYRHFSHITATYVRSLEPMLKRELLRALRDPAPMTVAKEKT